MKSGITIIGLAATAAACVAQQSITPRHPVTIPRGIVAASPDQQRMLAAVTNLPLRATQPEVRQALGKPTEASSAHWFYHLSEDRTEGGYYVTVGVSFLSNRLDKVSISFGHETLVPKETE